jgi:hypothetical protein
MRFTLHYECSWRTDSFTAVTMKNAVFWDVAPCRSCVNRRFGGTHCLHSHLLTLVPRSRFFLPWRWRRYIHLKRRFIQELHGATSQKTAFFTFMKKFPHSLLTLWWFLKDSGTNSGIIAKWCFPSQVLTKGTTSLERYVAESVAFDQLGNGSLWLPPASSRPCMALCFLEVCRFFCKVVEL